MNLAHLRYFVATVDLGSVTGAARALNVTQPALSMALKSLETELGAPLLERGPKSVSPTPAGKRLAERARAILAECAALKSDVKGGHREPLRLGILRTVPPAGVCQMAARLAELRPDFSLSVVEGKVERLARLLNEREIDLALSVIEPGAPGESMELAQEPYVALLPKDHPLAKKARLTLADFNGQPFVMRTDCESLADATRLLNRAKVRPRIVARTDQDDWAARLVAAGLGITIMGESAAHAAPEGAVARPIRDFPLFRTLGICWRTGADGEKIEAVTSIARLCDWR